MITLEIEGIRNIRSVKKTREAATFQLTLEGQLHINGHSKPVRTMATVTFMSESETTKMRMPGNLLAGRAQFKVALRDFGIGGPEMVVGTRVAEEVDVDVRFVASTQAADGPHNPCNPCNPCAKSR